MTFATVAPLALLALIVALLALAWRDNRRTVARVEHYQATWHREIGPARALLLALAEYDAARQRLGAARRLLDATDPGDPASERYRVALIEAHVAYDEARDRLHEALDRQQVPPGATGAGDERQETSGGSAR